MKRKILKRLVTKFSVIITANSLLRNEIPAINKAEKYFFSLCGP